MDFDDSPEDAAFRGEVRQWLDANATVRPPSAGVISLFAELEGDERDLVARAKAWQRRLAEGGWAAVPWPHEYGGRGASMLQAMIFDDEVGRYDVPARVTSIGVAMIGPTLIAHGTEEQKRRYLQPMLRGDEVWCQLWSEPGAGSDLARLATRAEVDATTGDFVLNGQKVWTSGAHYCDHGLGIFRSNPEAPKNRGISALIVDMTAPGITVRPLRQMTGGANFNEVFFDDVRVPAANLVGELHGGWTVALTTMMNERFAVGSVQSPSGAFPALAALAAAGGDNGGRGTTDPVVRQRLADVYILGRVFDLTTARVRSALSRGAIPGVEGSILKLVVATLGSRQAELALHLLGPHATLTGDWQAAFLGAPAVHIGGGTDEIQRNLIGEQVLGLPREPALDRGVPYRELT